MNAVGSVAIAVSGGNQQSGCQRQNPAQQAMQQILQYIQGFMAGQMLGQMLHGGQQNGCMCSQQQNPNFGGQNGNALGSMMAGMQLGALAANQGGGFGQQFGAQPFGGQQFGAQPFGVQPFGGQQFGAQPFGGQQFGAQPFGVQPFGAQQASFGLPNQGLSLGFNGQNANSLFNGLPNGLNGVPNPFEVGQTISPLAQGLPSLAFNTLGQNPNPGFAGSTNITGLIPPVRVPALENSFGNTIIPAGSGIPGAFGNSLNTFLG